MATLRRRGGTARTQELEVLRERHLLVVPSTTDAVDVDGLARTWFPTTQLATGRADLPGIGVLTGPHELSMEEAVTAEVPTPWVVAYDLDAPVQREPGPPSRRPDGLHRAFPSGLPAGGELAGLEFLLALARRLGGGLRPAGAGEVIVPDPASAMDFRLLCPLWIRAADVGAVLGHESHEGDEHHHVTLSSGGRTVDQSTPPPDGQPFEALLDMSPAGVVAVVGRLAPRPEPAVAAEDFATAPTAVYDIVWQAPDPAWRVAEHLDGMALACRERVRGPMESVTRTLAELGGGVVLDADGFLVDRYQL